MKLPIWRIVAVAVIAQSSSASPPPPHPTVIVTPQATGSFVVTDLGGAVYSIELFANSGSAPTFSILRGSADDEIATLKVATGGVTSSAYVMIGTETNPFQRVGEIVPDEHPEKRDFIILEMYVTGDVEEIHAAGIDTVRVGGNVGTVNVYLWNQLPFQSFGVFDMEVGGRIDGSIHVFGLIERLVVGGTIGTTSRSSVFAHHIEFLRAAAINSDIHGPFGTIFGLACVGSIRMLETSGGPGSDGSLRGTVATLAIPTNSPAAGFQIAGPMEATIAIGSGLEVGGGNAFSLPSGGLKGQIIMGFVGDQDWTAPVNIGTGPSQIVLDGDGPAPSTIDYQEAAVFLGGGAVGLVPFRLHATDCAPVAGAILNRTDAPDATNPILLRHYGPVWFDPLGPVPFEVERRGLGYADPQPWTSETACFAPALVAGLNGHATIVSLTPSRQLQAGFVYRVRLATDGQGANVLKCDVSPTSRPPVHDHSSDYTFTVEPLCPGDADNDGNVDFDDVLTVLAWFGAETTCLKFGDADRNGVVNFDDTLTVLANFENDCSLLELGGTGGGQVLEEAAAALLGALESMGFESLEHFMKEFENSDKATRDEMIRTLGELLGGKD